MYYQWFFALVDLCFGFVLKILSDFCFFYNSSVEKFEKYIDL